MDQLWAPWRLAYVSQEKPESGANPCFICRSIAEKNDRANLLVERTESAIVMLNRFPYNNGHLLIAPQAHLADLSDLPDAVTLEIQKTLQSYLGLLRKKLTPHGFNIGLNLGRAAGAGLPGHLHWHIVPRWEGDMNFMPVIADTKVIVQSLDALYDLLRGGM